MTTNNTFDDIYKSRWLKSDDIPDGDLLLTIQDVNAEAVGQDKVMKFVLEFTETDKALILNKTNAGTLANKYGRNPNDWIGKRIALYSTEIDFAGKTTLGVRIRLKNPQPVQQPAQQPVQQPQPIPPAPENW